VAGGCLFAQVVRRPNAGKVTAAALIRSYETEAQRQKLLVKKADLAQTRLSFIVNGLRRLYADEEFLTLLRAEAMHTLASPNHRYPAKFFWPPVDPRAIHLPQYKPAPSRPRSRRRKYCRARQRHPLRQR
jgi:hypothetical protein